MEGSPHFSQMFSSSFSGEELNHVRPPESVEVQITCSSNAVGGLSDEYLSPTCLQNENASSDAWQSSQVQAFQWSFDQGGNEKGKF